MYKRFYGLQELPFNLTPDSRFLFLSQRHKEAIASLLYGINERKGFICLTGEIGSGKTTICRALLNELSSNTKVAIVLNSFLSELELLQTINEEFGINSDFESKKGLIDELNRFLLHQRALGNNCVLIIDEAQNLTPEVLEQIRMLSNLETETDKLLQIVLMGQPELLSTLSLAHLEQLDQRITVRYHITTLSEDETVHYIKHRLFIAKVKIDIEFTQKALKLIFNYSKGLPRKINILCDRILLVGYASGTYTVSDKTVKTAINEIVGKLSTSPKRKIRRSSSEMPEFPTGLKVLLGLCVVLLAFCLSALALFVYSSGALFIRPPVRASSQTKMSRSEPNTSLPASVAYNWDIVDGVMRVSDPELARQASLVTLLSLWNVKIEAGSFDEIAPDNVKKIDILSLASNVGVKKVEINGSFDDVVRLNVPAVVAMRKGNGSFAPFVVVAGINGDTLTLADPLHGLTTATRKELLEAWRGLATVVYIDKWDLDGIEEGQKGERVEFLQKFLKSKKHLSGAVNGAYDKQTVRAVKSFQKSLGLEPTGIIDLKTAMMISTTSSPQTPTLFD